MNEHMITRQEVELNFSGFMTRLQEGEEWVAVDGQASVVGMTPKVDLERWEEVRARFSEFELPFP
ncbi:MAG: hypothetical protein H6728_01345 [Myxococcales bacterium]|nr:hypothetical protein [Myxococcales bacterium]MCB9641698.1 hypothetical protein [Myxococcales bacterium]